MIILIPVYVAIAKWNFLITTIGHLLVLMEQHILLLVPTAATRKPNGIRSNIRVQVQLIIPIPAPTADTPQAVNTNGDIKHLIIHRIESTAPCANIYQEPKVTL